MSDLQCPCTAWLVNPVGADRGRTVAAPLSGRRVARVFASSDACAHETADAVAEVLRAPVEHFGPRASTRAEIAAVSDAYRGETVLVVCDLAGLGLSSADDEPAEVAIDGDGWERVDRSL